MEQNKKNGAKRIAMLFYTLAIIFIILGLANLFIIIINPLIILFSIILIALSVLFFFTARDLKKGKDWARISAISISGLGIIWALTLLIQAKFITGFFYLILSGAIEYYLLVKRRTL